jgi:hypothetical protein
MVYGQPYNKTAFILIPIIMKNINAEHYLISFIVLVLLMMTTIAANSQCKMATESFAECKKIANEGKYKTNPAKSDREIILLFTSEMIVANAAKDSKTVMLNFYLIVQMYSMVSLSILEEFIEALEYEDCDKLATTYYKGYLANSKTTTDTYKPLYYDLTKLGIYRRD